MNVTETWMSGGAGAAPCAQMSLCLLGGRKDKGWRESSDAEENKTSTYQALCMCPALVSQDNLLELHEKSMSLAASVLYMWSTTSWIFTWPPGNNANTGVIVPENYAHLST